MGRMTEGRIADDDLDKSMDVDGDGRQGVKLSEGGGLKLGPNGLEVGGFGSEVTRILDRTGGRDDQLRPIPASTSRTPATTAVTVSVGDIQTDLNRMLGQIHDNLAALATKVNQITTFLGQ
jgi:hypothetical protein